ncbi:MAG: hypothetical protein ACRC0G_07360 [Fusobacteriaceae bacterium]
MHRVKLSEVITAILYDVMKEDMVNGMAHIDHMTKFIKTKEYLSKRDIEEEYFASVLKHKIKVDLCAPNLHSEVILDLFDGHSEYKRKGTCVAMERASCPMDVPVVILAVCENDVCDVTILRHNIYELFEFSKNIHAKLKDMRGIPHILKYMRKGILTDTNVYANSYFESKLYLEDGDVCIEVSKFDSRYNFDRAKHFRSFKKFGILNLRIENTLKDDAILLYGGKKCSLDHSTMKMYFGENVYKIIDPDTGVLVNRIELDVSNLVEDAFIVAAEERVLNKKFL